MKKSNFYLTPKHKFILLATAVATEEEIDSEYHVAAQCAITTPTLQKDLIDNGYITVDNAWVPTLTQRGLQVVGAMLNPAQPIGKRATPYTLNHFNAISDNRLIQLLLDTTEAIKSRAHKAASFADKLVGNSKMQVAYKYFKSLSPIFEAETVNL